MAARARQAFPLRSILMKRRHSTPRERAMLLTIVWILLGVVLGACALMMLVAGLRMRRVSAPGRGRRHAISAR